MEIRPLAQAAPAAPSSAPRTAAPSASPAPVVPPAELTTDSSAELTSLPATPAKTQVSLPLVDAPASQDYTQVELSEIQHEYLTAPLEAVPGMPMNVLAGAGQMIELEAGVSIKTSPEELKQQQENPLTFSYQGQPVEGFRLELSNGQNYFLAKNADATFYPNDPNLDMLANTVEFRGGELTDMRGLSESERQAITGEQ